MFFFVILLSFFVCSIFQRQVRQKMAEQGTSQTRSSLKDDAISQVLGPDRRGRVRGFGFGAVPSKIDGQTHASKRIKMLETALLANSQELQGLKMLVHKLLAQSNNGEKNNVSILAPNISCISFVTSSDVLFIVITRKLAMLNILPLSLDKVRKKKLLHRAKKEKKMIVELEVLNKMEENKASRRNMQVFSQQA